MKCADKTKVRGKSIVDKLTIGLFFIISMMTATTLAKTERKPNAAAQSQSFQYTLTSQEWSKQMLDELPVAFCDSREYFGHCFDVEKPSCEKTVSMLAKVCLKGINLPKSVRLSTVGLKLGHQLGSCIGSQYERSMFRKKKRNPTCQEIKQWL